MDKNKIVPIVLLVIVLAVGFFAFDFYSQNQVLTEDLGREARRARSLEEERDVLDQRQRRLTEENRELTRNLEVIQRQLSEIERERDNLKGRYDRITAERDQLVKRLEERPDPAPVRAAAPAAPTAAAVSDEYWADFVREKAQLEAELESFEKKILEIQSEAANLERKNREMSLAIDELSREKERLEKDLSSKERAFRIMSMDLVAERQKRGQAVDELTKLRDETTSLKHELVQANQDKSRIQGRLKDVLEERRSLQLRMAEAESIVKEKSLTLGELQGDLKRAITEGRSAALSGPVELPPIVVRPDSPATRGLRGEIIAVNSAERFVVFNLGEESGVRPGNSLRVMRDNREIASIEVVETRKSISAADIKDIAGGFDIREGDVVIGR